MFRTKLAATTLLFLAAAATPAAAVIDPFTVPQGPLTAGPGEIIDPELGVIPVQNALGSFRAAAPAMGDDAPAGSFATVAVGGGQWDCVVDVAVIDPVTANGGCGTAWDRGDGMAFDFSMVESFDLPVLEVGGSAALALLVVDANQSQAVAFVENVQEGLLVISRASFLPTIGSVDWSAIDALDLSVINNNGADARVRIGALGATGAIPGAQNPPPRPTDDELSPTISGNWFNLARDGEGCQLTREANESLFVLTCYMYRDGEQFWMIGTGVLLDGRIVSTDMQITTGADYGPLFDPADVQRIPFGTVVMDFIDCNTGSVAISPTAPGFEPVLLPMRRIMMIDCAGGLPDPVNVVRTGNFFDPLRDGEGFQLAVEGSTGLHVITYYTYLDGKPVWMIGTGTIQGNRIEFNDMQITSGTGYGQAFDAGEVVRTPFGRIILEFQDCNNASVLVDSDLPEFPDQNLQVRRILLGACS